MSEPDRITAHTRIADHAAEAKALVMSALRDKPAIAAIVAALARQVQQVEDAQWAVISITIASGEGDALDQYGELLEQSRSGLTDANYRPVLRATALARRSRAITEDVLSMIRAALGAVAFTYAGGGASVCLEVLDVIPYDPAILARLLRESVGAGIGNCVLVPPAALSSCFTFASDSVLDSTSSTQGLGDDGNPATGGQLTGAYA